VNWIHLHWYEFRRQDPVKSSKVRFSLKDDIVLHHLRDSPLFLQDSAPRSSLSSQSVVDPS